MPIAFAPAAFARRRAFAPNRPFPRLIASSSSTFTTFGCLFIWLSLPCGEDPSLTAAATGASFVERLSANSKVSDDERRNSACNRPGGITNQRETTVVFLGHQGGLDTEPGS